MPKKEKEKNKRKTHIVKNKGLRRVCAVVCLCFGLLAVALPFSRSNDKITVSAANNSALYPDNSIIIYTDYNPQFCITWAARTVSTMSYSPRFVINHDKFGIVIGNTFQQIVWTNDESEALGLDVPFYNCADGTNLRNPTPEYGYSIRCMALQDKIENGTLMCDASDVYDRVTGGEYTLGDFKVYNRVEYIDNDGVIENYNYVLYTLTLNPVYSSGVTRIACFKLYAVWSAISLDTAFIFDSTKVQTNLFNYNYDFTGILTDNEYYNNGYNDGYSKGYVIGYNDGDSYGFSRGDSVGYQRGISETLADITPWQVVVDGVNSFLNLELLPNVKLSVVLSVAFGCILLGFAIKIFLGG